MTLAELQSALASSGNSRRRTAAARWRSSVAPASGGTGNPLVTGGSALAAFGRPAVNQYGQVNAPTPNASRTSAAGAVHNILPQQIDALASDSSYHGINLLKGDSLTTTFNETGSSTPTIAGTTLDPTGLGLAGR